MLNIIYLISKEGTKVLRQIRLVKKQELHLVMKEYFFQHVYCQIINEINVY